MQGEMDFLLWWFHLTIDRCVCANPCFQEFRSFLCLYHVQNAGQNEELWLTSRMLSSTIAQRFAGVLPSYKFLLVLTLYVPFPQKGKMSALRLMKRHVRFREPFLLVGTDWDVPDEVAVFTPSRVYLFHVQLRPGNNRCQWLAVPCLLRQEKGPSL